MNAFDGRPRASSTAQRHDAIEAERRLAVAHAKNSSANEDISAGESSATAATQQPDREEQQRRELSR